MTNVGYADVYLTFWYFVRVNEMKKIQEIIRFIKNIFFIIKIVFQAAPGIATKLVICNILLGLIVSLNVYLWKYFVDSATISLNSGNLKPPAFWLITLALCTLFVNYFTKLSTYYREIAQEYMNCKVANIVMGKIDELDLSYFDDPKTYDSIEKVSNESVARCISILVMLVTLLRYITTFIGILVVIISLSGSIAIFMCVTMIPIFYVSISIAFRQYQIYSNRVQNLRLADYLKELSLKYENIKELKIYQAIVYLKNKMIEIYTGYIKEDKVYKKRFLRELTLTDILQYIFSTGIKVFTVFKSIIEKRTIGDLTMYISALDNMENSIRIILDSVASLYSDNLYMENLIALTKMESNMKDVGKRVLTEEFEVIEFKNVSFKYPNTEKYVLKDLNIKFEKKKSYALVGLNGSGKTTFVKLLMRLYDPQKGEVLIDGINIKEFTIQSLRENIGVIFQDFIRYPLTVKENINIGVKEKEDNLKSIIEAAKISGADEFINNLPLKYESMLQKEWDNGSELSVGQWQKIAIARAILKDSSILILDEPSSALDPKSEYEMFQKMKNLMIGKMSIMITHRFSNVRIVDEIFVMKNGEIVEFGTHENLMKKEGEYFKLYNIQAKYYK